MRIGNPFTGNRNTGIRNQESDSAGGGGVRNPEPEPGDYPERITRAGIHVTGLDLSQAMLDVLQAKLDRERRAMQARVALKCADMRDYRFSQEFKLVICAFNSFQHLMTTDDQLACLRNVHEYLAEDGRIVLNVFAPDRGRLTGRDETLIHVKRDPETGRDMDKRPYGYVSGIQLEDSLGSCEPPRIAPLPRGDTSRASDSKGRARSRPSVVV